MKIAKTILAIYCIFFVNISVQAQLYVENDIYSYIENYKDLAIREMQKYKIPASITLAQGIFESACGKSRLAVLGNNHFGIKCHKEWEGDTLLIDDDALGECFRKYEKPEDSFEDHSLFLTTRSRYKELFLLNQLDYSGWAYGLKKAGYATNPKYSERIISLIERFSLAKYDTTAIVDSRQEFQFTEKKELATVEKQNKKEPEKTKIKIFTAKNGDFKAELNPFTDRQTYSNNKVFFIIAKEGDTYSKIAEEVQVGIKDLKEYNDIDANSIYPVLEEVVYIEKKERENSHCKIHIVQNGETLRYISQKYAIQLHLLMKLNPHIGANALIREGDKIKLKR